MEASDGTRLAYEVEGQGPPLVLHLGAGCDSRLWRAAGYVEPLAHSYSCILFDHRGHGLSDNPRGAANYHLDRLTADVVELLDLLGFASVAFWGYSSGISPGVRLAERFPDRVWALVASGSVGPPDTPEDLAAWSASSAAEFREHGWDKLIARFEAQEPEPIPDWMTASIRETDVAQFIDLIESYVDWHWEEWDALPALKAPVLFLTGELEDKDDDVGRIIKTMRHGELLRMAGLGHINAFLNTATVLPRVQSFLSAHAPRL